MSLLFRSLELDRWLRIHFVSSRRCFYRCPAVHATGIRLHLPFTMPILCRHPNGTTHGVHIFGGDVICDWCERVFDQQREATPEQVLRRRHDAFDVAYQASTDDLLWTLFLDDPSRPHDRQKPKQGPGCFPPGTRLVDPDSGCIPCKTESDIPAALRASAALRAASTALNHVFIQKPPGLDLEKPPGLSLEEDRKQEGTEEGAPESSETNTSVYLRI